MNSTIPDKRQLLERLAGQLLACRYCHTVEMDPNQKEQFKIDHPNAHFLIGDFEIRCINRELIERYELNYAT